jgi:hypothetical protein
MTGSAYLCQAKRILQAGDELCHTRLNYAYRQRKKGYEKAARLWMKQAQQVPSINTRDPYFRWLKYVRYADGNFLKKKMLGNACIMRTSGDIRFRELLGNISHLFLCYRWRIQKPCSSALRHG